MPPDSYVDWGAVHFYTPLNRTSEQILTDEKEGEINFHNKAFINIYEKVYLVVENVLVCGIG